DGMQIAFELISQTAPRADDALRRAVVARTGKQADNYVTHKFLDRAKRDRHSASQSARNFDDTLGELFDLLLKRIAGDELTGHFSDRDGQIDDFVIAPARADLGGIDAEIF